MEIRGYALTVFVAALLTAPALGLSNVERSASDVARKTTNYQWWHRLDDRTKDSALQSAILGIAGEWIDAYREARTDAENALAAAEDTKSIPRMAAAVVEYGPYPPTPRFSRPLAYYRHGINDFYAKNPGARKANLFIILMCLSDKPTVSCAEIVKNQANL